MRNKIIATINNFRFFREDGSYQPCYGISLVRYLTKNELDSLRCTDIVNNLNSTKIIDSDPARIFILQPRPHFTIITPYFNTQESCNPLSEDTTINTFKKFYNFWNELKPSRFSLEVNNKNIKIRQLAARGITRLTLISAHPALTEIKIKSLNQNIFPMSWGGKTLDDLLKLKYDLSLATINIAYSHHTNFTDSDLTELLTTAKNINFNTSLLINDTSLVSNTDYFCDKNNVEETVRFSN